MTQTSNKPLTILVIEDDPGDFGMDRAYLRQAGLGISGVATGLVWAQTLAQGIAAARQAEPDIVLLDLALPDSSGLATLKTLRLALPHIPIVVLTGNEEKAMALAALECGAQDYLVKGQFDYDALGRAIRHAQVRSHILEERDFTQAALDGLPGLFYLIDKSGRFLRWNQNFEKVSGYSAAEIATMSPLDFFGRADHGPIAAAIAQAYATGETLVEAELLAKDQTQTSFLFCGKRFLLEQQACLMGLGIDITQRKVAKARIERLSNLEPLTGLANASLPGDRSGQDGRKGYRFPTAEMQARSTHIQQIESALRSSLERGELSLHYQPQVALSHGRVIGAEALLRWSHPKLGQVSPVEFIPIAEASGQFVQIGEWVLRMAVRQMKAWLDQGLASSAAPMVMSVNLSVAQFRHPSLIAQVMQILQEEQLAPEFLELELTEGVALSDPLGAIKVMNALHAQGIRMSIDDFGTGYSSLSHLKRFKVYKLKIDQSFVRKLTDDPDDKAIVSAIISMAGSLGLQTIAEGVETEGQLAFLRDSGCDEVQGFHYCKPLPVPAFEAFLRQARASSREGQAESEQTP